MSILDEIDSGLDVDALRDVAKAVNGILTPKNSVLMITHYRRLLQFIQPAFIHIMVRICKINKQLHNFLFEVKLVIDMNLLNARNKYVYCLLGVIQII